MKYAICLLVAAMALCFVVSPVEAQCTETTFTPEGDEGFWNNPDNWSDGEPNSGKIAIIPSGLECLIANTAYDAEACSIEVFGVLRINDPTGEGVNTLTVHEDSIIDGTMEISNDGQLFILADDLTIDGSGDILLSGGIDGFSTSGGSHTLTLENDCTGSLDASCGVVLHGFGKVSIDLTNNGLVIGDACPVSPLPSGLLGSLDVAGPSANGSGIWRVDGGSLGIRTTVTGSGTWQVWEKCTSFDYHLIVDSACTGLSGDVEIGAPNAQDFTAHIDLKEDFCTTGDLNWFPLGGTSDVTARQNRRFRVGVSDCSGV